MTKLILVACAYFVAGWLGLQIPFSDAHITLVWLPTGIAVAALLRWGWRVWPGIYLGAVLTNLAIGSSLPLATGIAIGNTLAPLLTVWWLRRSGFHQAFDRQKDVGIFIAAGSAGMLFSAVGGVASLVLAGLMPVQAMSTAVMAWWMGDSVGVLLAAPLLLTLNRNNLAQLRQSRHEILLWLLVAGPVAWLAFVREFADLGRTLPLAFLTLPLFAWAALRFGITFASLAGLGFSVIAAWSTASGRGTFFLPDTQISLFLLWSYMATTVVTGLIIAALQAHRLEMEKALSSSEARYRLLSSATFEGIAMSERGRIIDANDQLLSMLGYTREELIGMPVVSLCPPEDHAHVMDKILSGLESRHEHAMLRKDGTPILVEAHGQINEREGRDIRITALRDITASRQAEQLLRIAATVFESQEGMVVTDADNRILRVNRAFTDITGYTAEDAIGRTSSLLKSGRHGSAFYAAMWDSLGSTGSWHGEIWNRRKNGEIYPEWLTITAVKGSNGEIINYVSTLTDITLRKEAEEEIRNLAFYDPLTRLPNRRLLLDRLHHALAASARNKREGALLFIDLDNFKTLNDSLGHVIGDQLLKQVALRLVPCLRECDTVARLGGDEFVVMLEDLSGNPQEAATQTVGVAEKILTALNLPYSLAGQLRHSTASIGATLFIEHQNAVEELLKRADLAMYEAKAAGRNTLRFYDPDMQAAVTARATLEADLRQGLVQHEFQLYYQSQVDQDERVTGAEVLVRWMHPRRGLVGPTDFIPLAEETGLILPLGNWVLETACAQLASWAARPQRAHLSLSVNVSARQFHHAGFVEQVLAVLDQTGADPQKLKLELTESLLLHDVEDTIGKMSTLKARGVRFSLDDFGTGYSSLAYLKRLPLEQLKIDQSFVRDILTDPNDAAITRMIVALASSMGLGVIAEGVETVEQRDILFRNGCHAYQGYLFSRPVPLQEFEALAAASAMPAEAGA